MKEQIIRFFKMWTLPLGMFAGVGVYLMFHYIPWLSPLKVLAKGANDYILPLMVFIQLFTTFCKVNPREMRICRWHIIMITVQLVCCLAVALPIHFFPDFSYNVVAQGALVCLIVPTGTAAAVIAGRLGRLYQLWPGIRPKEHDTCHLGILHLPHASHFRGAKLLHRLAERGELVATVVERKT